MIEIRAVKKVGLKIAHSVAQAYYLQVIMTAISFPLLVWWGLPISTLSIIGNMLFGPFLAAFLAASSLLFFTQLIGLPNQLLIWIIEKIVALWFVPLSWAENAPLVAAAPVHGGFLIAITLVLMFALIPLSKRSLTQKCFYATILLAVTFFVIKLIHACNAKPIETLTIEQIGTVIVAREKNRKKLCIDHGAFSKKIIKPKTIEFSVRSSLIKAIGSTYIDTFILTEPTEQAIKNVTVLLEHISISTLYLPLVKEVSPRWKHAYFELKEKCGRKNSELKRYKQSPNTHIYDSVNAHVIINDHHALCITCNGSILTLPPSMPTK